MFLMSKQLQGIVEIVNLNDLEGFVYIDYIFIHTYLLYTYILIATIPCNGFDVKIIQKP